ncbi:hypothetical protein CP985_09735, partial [Malaciobacter mytili LMG 24559]
MAKKSKNEVIDKYLDIAEDAKEFAERLDRKYNEGLEAGESKLQAFVTGTGDSLTYIVVKKYAQTLQFIKFDKKSNIEKELGEMISDEAISNGASLVADNVGIALDKIADFLNKKQVVEVNTEKKEVVFKESINDTEKNTIVEFRDENSILVKTNDNKRILIHKTQDNKEERYILDNEGNLESYEIKNEKGEYKKYENNSLEKIDKKEIENLSNTLNDTTFDKVKLENSIKNIDKSNLQEPSEVGVISLKAGQTISHIAQNTKFSSIELLEYNNLTLEDAKNLPVGYKVLVPKEPPLEIQGENGVIKLFKNPDDTFTLRVPDENNNKTNITYDENSDLLIYG